MSYYNGENILKEKDINNNEPEIVLVTGNRTAGKSFYWKKWLLDNFLSGKGQFMIIYRNFKEVNTADKDFYEDISETYSPECDMDICSQAGGIYYELIYEGVVCGYATYFNAYRQIKRKSAVFHNVNYIFIDEFQEEFGNYIDDEVGKFLSIHMSISRGYNQRVRFVKSILLSNSITTLNPYFQALNIQDRMIKTNLSYQVLKGDGWVLERFTNLSASQVLTESAFNRAFKSHEYMQSAINNVAFMDNKSFIIRRPKNLTYTFTIISNLKPIGVWTDGNIVYCDFKVMQSKKIYCIQSNVMTSNIPILRFTHLYNVFKAYYTKGRVYYSCLEIKKELIDNLFKV